MKALILGCGNIGSVATQDLAESMSSVEVFVADKNLARAKEVAKAIGRDNVARIQLNASNYSELVDTLDTFDLVMGFLPGDLGYRLVKACVDMGKDLVDVSYMPGGRFIYAREPLNIERRGYKSKCDYNPKLWFSAWH